MGAVMGSMGSTSSTSTLPTVTTTSIDVLCDDMLYKVFDRLPVKQVLAVQTLNKQFQRCAKKWLKTVDQLVVNDNNACLRKTFNGKPIYKSDPDATIIFPEKTIFARAFRHYFGYHHPLFTSLEKTLTACPDIRILELCNWWISASEFIQLISRCPNINHFSFSIDQIRFTDQEWSRLVELIKHCQIRLRIEPFAPRSIVKQLEQLFKTATQIKKVRFLGPFNSIFLTMAFLDESVEVTVNVPPYKQWRDFHFDSIFANPPELVRLLSQRIDNYITHSAWFQELPIRCYKRVSCLEISSKDSYNFPLRSQPLEFPRLRYLRIDELDCRSMANFFDGVKQMDQLKTLVIFSANLLTQDFNKIMEKAPDLEVLETYWTLFNSAKLPEFETSIQFLAQPTTTIPHQELRVALSLSRLEDVDIDRIIVSLTEFANRKTNKKLTIRFLHCEKQTAFEQVKTMPKNVEVIWLFSKCEPSQ